MRFSFVSYACLIGLSYLNGGSSVAWGQTKSGVDLTGNARAEIETPLTLSSQSKKTNPTDIYLEVRRLSLAGERFLKANDLKAAQKAYEKADAILDGLSKEYPSWEPQMLLFRKTNNEQNLAVIKKRLEESNANKKTDLLGSTMIAPLEGPGSAGDIMPMPGGRGKSARETDLENRLKEVLDELSLAQVRIRDLQADLDKEKRIKNPSQAAREKHLEQQVKTLETELTKLRTEILTVRSEREQRLQKRLDETMLQLAAAHRRIEELERGSTGAVTNAAITRLNQQLLRSESELKAVTQALKDSKATLDNVMARAVRAETDASAYKAQLDKAREQLKLDQSNSNKVLATLNKQYLDLEKKLKASEEEKKTAESEVKHLQERLKETEDQLVDVTKQKEAIEDERNQLADIIQLNNPSTTKAILDENLSLANFLKKAEDRIKELESGGEIQSAELDSVRTELALAKSRLIELRDENLEYRKRVSELNEKLRVMDSELERMSSEPNVDPRIVAENNLLRQEITRQLKVLESREKSRQLLETAYKQVKKLNPEFAESVKILENANALELTQKDREILDNMPKMPLLGAGGPPLNEQMAAYVERQMQVEALGKSAIDAFNKGRLFASEQLYQNLLEAHPGHYAGHVNLGVVLLKQRKIEDAVRTLQAAVDINPDHPTGQFLLGVAFYELGRDASAQIALMAAASLDPSNAVVYFYLGNIASSSGKTKLAIQEYTKALDLDPSLIDIHYNMANVYAKAGQLDEARKSYDLSIRAGALPDPVLEQQLRIVRPVSSDSEAKPASDANNKVSEKPDNDNPSEDAQQENLKEKSEENKDNQAETANPEGDKATGTTAA